MPQIISRKTVDTDIAQAISMGVSQSEYGTYDLCHYRWYLEKVLMLNGTKPEFVLTAGTAFHTGMDWMYRTGGKKIGVPPLEFNKVVKLTPEEEEEAEYWHKVLFILIKVYRLHYKDDFSDAMEIISLEQVLRVEIDGILHCGALDLVVNQGGRNAIWDHKTKGMKGRKSTAANEWSTRFQFLLYALMWNLQYPKNKVNRFMVNIIMKPALEMRKGETMPAFLMRLQQDVNTRRVDYFKREQVPIDKSTLDNFRARFLQPRIDTMKMLQRAKPGSIEYSAMVLKPNSSACFSFGRQCAFYAHCHNGKKLEELPLIKRKAKHEHYEEKEL
jgi:hypothetical protein